MHPLAAPPRECVDLVEEEQRPHPPRRRRRPRLVRAIVVAAFAAALGSLCLCAELRRLDVEGVGVGGGVRELGGRVEDVL